MSTDTALVLVTSKGNEYEISTVGDKDISQEEEFVKAKVLRGKWVVYSDKNFPYDSKYQILDSNGTHKLVFSPRSAKILPFQLKEIVLYSSPHFTGVEKSYNEACNDITDVFPATNPGGVSSAIVWPGGLWRVHTKTNMGGLSHEMKEGYYGWHTELPFGGDKIQSLEPLH